MKGFGAATNSSMQICSRLSLTAFAFRSFFMLQFKRKINFGVAIFECRYLGVIFIREFLKSLRLTLIFFCIINSVKFCDSMSRRKPVFGEEKTRKFFDLLTYFHTKTCYLLIRTRKILPLLIHTRQFSFFGPHVSCRHKI